MIPPAVPETPRRSPQFALLALLLGGLLVCGVAVAAAFVLTARVQGTAAPAPAYTPWPTAVPPTPLPVSSGVNELESQINAVYERVGPSVVNITNRSLSYDFFMRPIASEGTGSGFFYDDAGHIVTNYHVIEGAQELTVTTASGKTLPAGVVGADPASDLAVIRVDVAPGEMAPVPFGDSAALRVGQFVVAIGNPFGLERTLTTGVVSSLGRVIESTDANFIGEVVQTDASINPGNSGGPLLNLNGELIGVNTAILSPSGASAGIGFAIPAHTVKRVVDALITTGRYEHPSLGIHTFTITAERAALLARAGVTLPVDQGLLLVELDRGGPAEQAGLLGGQQLLRIGNVVLPVGGDVLIAIDGQAVRNEQELTVYLETRTTVGQVVQVTVVRGDRQLAVPVTLGAAGQ